MRPRTVELSILASPADVGFLEATVRHQVAAFSGEVDVARRVLVVDVGVRSGAAVDELLAIASRLSSSEVIDEVRRVDWSDEVVRETMRRWYGDPATDPRSGRRAIYQYAFSVDSSKSDRLLHIDSDMLFHGDMGQWLRGAVEALDADPDAVAFVPSGAVPQATRLIEWVLGRRVDRPTWPAGLERASTMTSRTVLLDRPRVVDRALPLVRRGDEQWEVAMGNAFARVGLVRLTDIDPATYMLHPHQHNAAFEKHLRGLITMVERGTYPYRRFGKPWDITTEGWKFLPWRAALSIDRLR